MHGLSISAASRAPYPQSVLCVLCCTDMARELGVPFFPTDLSSGSVEHLLVGKCFLPVCPGTALAAIVYNSINEKDCLCSVYPVSFWKTKEKPSPIPSCICARQKARDTVEAKRTALGPQMVEGRASIPEETGGQMHQQWVRQYPCRQKGSDQLHAGPGLPGVLRTSIWKQNSQAGEALRREAPPGPLGCRPCRGECS